MATLTETVEYKANLADNWTTGTHLHANTVDFRTAPGMPKAVLSRRYGFFVESDGTRHTVTALDLRGQYVKITIADGTNTVYWYGIVEAQDDEVHHSHPNPDDNTVTVYAGETMYTAYGMDRLLQQEVADSLISDGSTIKRALSFNNADRARNSQILGNRSATTNGDGIYTFQADNTDRWTALTAAEYLLQRFNASYGTSFALAGQSSYLDNINGAWSQEGKTYYQLLTELINPSRGFTFFVDNQTIQVVSISDSDLGSYIPANPNVVDVTLNESDRIEETHLRHIENVHYDNIEVHGERLLTCFTLAVGNGLVADWSSSLESDYNAATDDNRTKDKYAPVYTRFRLTPGWNGNDINGNNAIPVINPTDGTVDTASKQNLWERDLLFNRNIPLMVSDTQEPRPPLVWVDGPDGSTLQRVDNPSDEELEASALRPLDDRAGLQIDAPYPHYYGKNAFTGDSGDPTVLDYSTLHATVAMWTDELVRVEKAAQEATPRELNRTKRIYVPDAHLWYVITGTVIDVSESAQETAASGIYQRDDTWLLERIADLARIWYGRQRATITAKWADPIVIDRLGQVIDEAYTGGSSEPAGTLISHIRYRLHPRQTTELETEWQDIDLVRAVRNRGGSGENGGMGMPRSIAGNELANLPARLPVGRRTTPVYAKITADNGDGTYDATEQIWDASANDWTDKTNGRTFDTTSGTEPPIQEWNNTTGLTDNGNPVVAVYRHVNDAGNKQWLFRLRTAGGDIPAGTVAGQIMRWDETNGTWVVTTIEALVKNYVANYTAGADQVIVHRGSDDTIRWLSLNNFSCP